MKVIALGGSGAMGRPAVRTAVEDDLIDEIVIADLDGEAAARFAAECGPKVQGVAIDVRDTKALEALLADADVVMNTVGPFFRFGLPILRAAIASGCHYVDINDDWEPTLEMLDLDADAQKAGVTALIGFGASPGVSNLLAVRALSALDRADEVFTVWDLDAGVQDPEPAAVSRGDAPSAAIVHFVQQITGRIRAWEDGAPRDVRPLRKRTLTLPGLGEVVVHTVGHPESLTLPRTYPGLRVSANAFTAQPSTARALWLIGKAVDIGLVSLEAAAGWIDGAAREGGGTSGDAALPPLFAVARGEKGGHPATAAAILTQVPRGGMGPMTGIPLGIGLSLLASGNVQHPGVSAAEAIVDPSIFFQRFARWCGNAAEDPEGVVRVAVT